MTAPSQYDVVYLGHLTKDVIVRAGSMTTGPGGPSYYGCQVIARMGLRSALVTRLAREDAPFLDEIRSLGVHVFPTFTPESTTMQLTYTSENPDHRTVRSVGDAGPIAPEEVATLKARAFVLGGAQRGEISVETVYALLQKDALLVLDVQGFLRVNRDGEIAHEEWAEARDLLPRAGIVKADIVEASFLTGEKDAVAAARALAESGPREVIITSREGIVVLADGRLHQLSWCAHSLNGRTGRGDTCVAAYVAKRLTAPPAESAQWAAALTSLKLEHPGPFRQGIAEVRERLRMYGCLA